MKIRKKGKAGSATAETILVIAIFLVIIITIFYPQISGLISTTLTKISNWFNGSLNSLGIN